MAQLACVYMVAVSPLLCAATSPGQSPWFTPPGPSPGALLQPDPAHRLTIELGGTEEIAIVARRLPIERDPYQAAPIEPLRTWDAGASWGSTHPGQFCCASQYDTGLDGQAGR